MNVTKEDAIMSLRPGAEWFMDDGDVENITWITEGVEPLTEEEVAAEMDRLQLMKDQEEQRKRTARESAIQKLATLGLTLEEVTEVIGQ